MAPYTMSIVIDNRTPYDINFVGYASMKLDPGGWVEGKGNTVRAKTTAQGVELIKGGGTEGLFMVAGFSIPGGSQNVVVWCTMSAASGAKVSVLINCFDSSEQMSSFPDRFYLAPGANGLTTGRVIRPITLDGTEYVF